MEDSGAFILSKVVSSRFYFNPYIGPVTAATMASLAEKSPSKVYSPNKKKETGSMFSDMSPYRPSTSKASNLGSKLSRPTTGVSYIKMR